MKATSDAVYDYNLLSNQIEWNENLSIFGYSPGEVEPGLEWWAERIHPEDRESTLSLLDIAIRNDPGHFQSTYRFRCADGHYRYVTDRGFVLKDEAGLPIRLIGAIHDDHIYHQMFEHSPQPMWAFDLHTFRFLAVNRKAIQIYGYTREEFLSMTLMDIRPPEDVPLLLAVLNNPDREHEGHTIWRHLTKAGQLLNVEVRTQDSDLTGTPSRMSVITDVSRRLIVEDQIREAQKLDAIGHLAGGIAHDFQNFLSIIRGFSQQVLARTSPTHPSYSDIEAIDDASSRAIALTQQLLTFARQDKSKPTSIHWDETVAAAEPLLRKLLPARISMEFVYGAGLVSLQMDPRQMEQILFNLCTNARDAILDQGQIRITSATVHLSPDHPDFKSNSTPGPYLQLTVADNGSGISDAVLAHIFEPFFSTKAAGAGTGLGLSTVYGIVHQNHGWIRLDTIPGQGTEFRLYFPCTIPKPSGQHTILIIDDEPDLRRLIAESLQAAGFTTTQASNGIEALAALASAQIDLVVTDIVMPEKEGLETIQLILRRYPTIPIIAISGAFNGQFLPLAKAFGARTVMQKPFEMANLLKEIHQLLY